MSRRAQVLVNEQVDLMRAAHYLNMQSKWVADRAEKRDLIACAKSCKRAARRLSKLINPTE